MACFFFSLDHEADTLTVLLRPSPLVSSFPLLAVAMLGILVLSLLPRGSHSPNIKMTRGKDRTA
eukprot:5311846-Prorocentrum_lima.AAC.1